MALNLSRVTEVSAIPSRVRGGATSEEFDAIVVEFQQLIDMAAKSAKGAIGIEIVGAADCNKYTNALAKLEKAHPSMWACLSTAGGKYDAKGKMLSTTLYAAAKPQERKLEKLKERLAKSVQGVTVRKAEPEAEDTGEGEELEQVG